MNSIFIWTTWRKGEGEVGVDRTVISSLGGGDVVGGQEPNIRIKIHLLDPNV
jgi:hypothetical protein